ncbi:MAG: TraB/GumN family protein [Bacillota bacterium]
MHNEPAGKFFDDLNTSLLPFNTKSILEKAIIPEHSVHFMQSMSDGEPFLVGPYLFISSSNLLLAIGYPLSGHYNSGQFDQALTQVLTQTRARDCMAISPSLPERLIPHRKEQDHYYVLPADASIPSRNEYLAKRAAQSLRVEEGRTFTLAHRRLWAEFIGRVPLSPIVRRLYERTELVLSRNSHLILLNAWDKDDRLAACLLLDLAPLNFLSYIIGAHSRIYYTPYASDLLFREMIQVARREGKKYLHLGLGVNKGISRFKTKWGAAPSMPYEMAAWQEKPPLSARELMQMLAPAPGETMTKQQYLESFRNEKRFAMLWEIEKGGQRSWIGGTAHFFRYSFQSSFRELFDKVDKVIFEGPLDQVSLDQVAEVGKSPEPGAPRLMDFLNNEEVRQLERVIYGPRGTLARLLKLDCPEAVDVRYYLGETRPWMAFFSLWSCFLRRKGWNQSVDLEAWHLARDMGKIVFGMETISEQIATLESIPTQRIINFFRECRQWSSYIKRHEHAYLNGNLAAMMGTTAEFPSRTQMVINRRDETFLERMLPYLEKGSCVVLVGSAHMFNLREMIANAGYNIKQCSL